jgi:hypothetical protein
MMKRDNLFRVSAQICAAVALTNRLMLAVFVSIVVAGQTVSFAQLDYGLYYGDRDLGRGAMYVDPNNWTLLAQFTREFPNGGPGRAMCYGIAFSPDGRTAWVGSHLDGVIHEYDAATGRQISSVQSPVPSPRKMATAPFGTNQYYLYVASYRGLYAYGPLPSANPSWTLLADIRGDAVRYSREGNAHYLYATNGWRVVKLAVSGANVTQVWESPDLGSQPLDVDIAPAVNEVLVAFYGGTIKRLSAANGAVLSPDFIGSPLGGIEYVGIAVAPIPGRTLVYILGYWPWFYTYERQPNGSGAPAAWPMQPVYLTGRKTGYAIVIGPRWNPIVRCPEDITGDGVVDDADLLRVLFAFGTSCQ